MTEPMNQVNEIIQSSFKCVYQTATLRERKLIGRWLEERVDNKKESDELEELLYNIINCLKRGVFPDLL